MGWRRDEVWLDTDLLWFREQADGLASSVALHAPLFFDLPAVAERVAAAPYGLLASRRRRAELRRRQTARRTRAAAVVIGPAMALTLAGPRASGAARPSDPLREDPPSLAAQPRDTLTRAPRGAPLSEIDRRSQPLVFPEVVWNRATSHGLQYSGWLSGGTQLPLEGPGWVTWNPNTDSVPNAPHRLYGHERVIRKLLAVIEGYHADNPGASKVVVGDLSFRHGGPMDQHRSHQNGLDVDVYYPRLDGTLRPPRTPDQVDRRLTQDLLDRFVAAGAQIVFVGYRTGLRGRGDVVEPYPNHEDHLHVRFRNPRS